ncbi:solute carrier family 25 [Thecamonas trahens ATCC 50062]|uniref:Solute carrier family 25 n=1 Tax=Thecamonas trahens ATCC 50062 TaxID=461836 RepID=A0A0L0DPQ3_THETB|nr:solute carrier family 25 [Thecamonas trahens ATCC 50062]KNC53408.1 solute carrier family 25 [Thecamonas trahens ATCC 50062]|eukprot:XP_013754447.1 solute carrier family 25 [Thecamonas trahens ATCC 50062]
MLLSDVAEPGGDPTHAHAHAHGHGHGKADGAGEEAEVAVKEKKSVSMGHLVAGGLSGALSRTLTAPLDRLKILYEVQADHSMKRSMWRDLKAIGEREGMRGYFRGNGANVLKIVPKMALKFYGFEFFKNAFMADDASQVTFTQRLLAGMSSAAVSQFTIQPLDCVKVRIAASDAARYKGIIDCVTKMWRYEGLRAFYNGVVPSVTGIIPSMGVDLAIYDSLKSVYRNHLAPRLAEPDEEISDAIPAPALLVIGMISTSAAYAVGQPFGLIRARLMVQGVNTGYESRYSGAIDVIRQTVKRTASAALVS